MIPIALTVWFTLTALSAAYDAFRRTPEMTVMKWGWLLVTLYTGPVGAALYVLSCQEPSPGTHADFVRPLWKQGIGSTIHCMAGDATGIIVAAAVTLALGLRMWQDLIGEYVFGFAFGLLIFQALFMRKMLGGSYATAVRRAFLPEWLSMNAVMTAMVPVMVVLMSRDTRAMEPGSPHFWAVMSLAALAGGVVAYPVNVWLVAAGLKHGMGTVAVLGEGGHSVAAEQAGARTPMPNMAMPDAPTSAEPGAGRSAGTAPIPEHGGAHGSSAAVGTTPAQIAAVTVLTLVALGAGVVIAGLGGDLGMRGRMDAPAAPATGTMPGM